MLNELIAGIFVCIEPSHPLIIAGFAYEDPARDVLHALGPEGLPQDQPLNLLAKSHEGFRWEFLRLVHEMAEGVEQLASPCI